MRFLQKLKAKVTNNELKKIYNNSTVCDLALKITQKLNPSWYTYGFSVSFMEISLS